MSDVYDLAIIGSGFTGLSAGVQATRMRMKTILIEQMIMGGQILNTDLVENYPGFPKGVSGMDLITGAEEQASNAGLEYGFGAVTAIDASKQPIELLGDGERWLAKTVIIAAGGEHRKLGVPGESELEGRGVSHCATCDGMFFQDQAVAVIGGGDSAMDEGLYLTKMCSKVYIISRDEEFTGLKILRERVAENPKIEVIHDTVVDSINGDGSVTSLTLRDVKTGGEARARGKRHLRLHRRRPRHRALRRRRPHRRRGARQGRPPHGHRGPRRVRRRRVPLAIDPPTCQLGRRRRHRRHRRLRVAAGERLA